MEKIGKIDLVNDKNCIEDWAMAHWAWRLQ